MTIYYDRYGKFWRSSDCRCKDDEACVVNTGFSGQAYYTGSEPEYDVWPDCWGSGTCGCDDCRVTDGSLFEHIAQGCSTIDGRPAVRYIRRFAVINIYNAVPVSALAKPSGACLLEKLLIDGNRVIMQARHNECNPYDLCRYGYQHSVDIMIICRKTGHRQCVPACSIAASQTLGLNSQYWRMGEPYPGILPGSHTIREYEAMYADYPYEAPYDNQSETDEEFE